MRARHCYYASFRVLRPDSSTLLITIRADCAKRDETGTHRVCHHREAKQGLNGAAGRRRGQGYIHGASYLRRKKRVGETPCRRGKGGRQGGCEGEKEYETEQLKLGMVPTCAYNIRQKFVNASRPPGRRFRLFSRHVYLAQAQVREREKDRYVRIV